MNLLSLWDAKEFANALLVALLEVFVLTALVNRFDKRRQRHSASAAAYAASELLRLRLWKAHLEAEAAVALLKNYIRQMQTQGSSLPKPAEENPFWRLSANHESSMRDFAQLNQNLGDEIKGLWASFNARTALLLKMPVARLMEDCACHWSDVTIDDDFRLRLLKMLRKTEAYGFIARSAAGSLDAYKTTREKSEVMSLANDISNGKTLFDNLKCIDDSGPRDNSLKTVRPSFSNLFVGTDYQLQVSNELEVWRNDGVQFTAASESKTYPRGFGVENGKQCFLRLRVVKPMGSRGPENYSLL